MKYMFNELFRVLFNITLLVGTIVGLMFLFSNNAKASDTVELVGPGITWHVIDGGASSLYAHQISQDGRLIYTPQIGLRKTHIDNLFGYNSLTVFAASNSIGSPIYGAMGGTGAEFFHMFDIGIVMGGYIQNNEDFKAKGIVPFSLTGDTNAFVPLLGIEMNLKFDLGNNVFLGWNNMITPIITNHNLSLGYRY